MPRGGYRPGSGRKKKALVSTEAAPRAEAAKASAGPSPADIVAAAAAYGLTPLEYALQVMNNPEADQARRDRMCAVAMPFCHPKAELGAAGKKEEREAAAAKAATGKYATPPAPKLVVNNT